MDENIKKQVLLLPWQEKYIRKLIMQKIVQDPVLAASLLALGENYKLVIPEMIMQGLVQEFNIRLPLSPTLVSLEYNGKE